MSPAKEKRVLASLPGAGPEPVFESARFQARLRVFTVLFTAAAGIAILTSDFGERDNVLTPAKRFFQKGLDRIFQLDEKELEEVRRRAAEKQASR